MWPRSISQQPLIADRKLLFPFFFLFKCLQHGQAFSQTHRTSLLCCCSSEDNMNVLQVKTGSSLGQKPFSDIPVLYFWSARRQCVSWHFAFLPLPKTPSSCFQHSQCVSGLQRKYLLNIMPAWRGQRWSKLHKGTNKQTEMVGCTHGRR